MLYTIFNYTYDFKSQFLNILLDFTKSFLKFKL